jgi:hypothetical protein
MKRKLMRIVLIWQRLTVAKVAGLQGIAQKVIKEINSERSFNEKRSNIE